MAQGISVEQTSEADQQQQTAKGPGSNRSQLVQRLLDQTSSLPAFLHDLLTTQAITVAGTEAAGFLIERSEKGLGLRPIGHIRPDNSPPETRQAALQAFNDIVRPCVEQGKDGAIEVGAPNDAHELQFCLVTLLRSEGDVVAVSAVITRCINTERARQRLMSMQLVAGYFELFTLRRASDQNRQIAQSHQKVLQLATSVATAEGFESAGKSLCNELASRTSAARVSLGWVKGHNIKVRALSHTEQFDKKQELIVQLERAMEECVDQDAVVQFDPTPGGKNSDNVTRAHQQLSRAQGGNIILSLPLRRRAEVVGVITLEFLPNQPLGPQVAQGVAIAVELLAPQLFDRFENDRWLITKAGISTRETAKLAIGPKHMLPKLIIILSIVALLILFNLIPFVDTRMTYRVAAPFQFAATERRSLSAPYEGFLGELSYVKDGKIIPASDMRKQREAGEITRVAMAQLPRVRPGVAVKAGDVLMEMDVTEVLKQQVVAQQKAFAAEQESRKFRGQGKTADQLQSEARMRQSQAEAAFYQDQIDRLRIASPIDGVILSGDLYDKQGSKVEQGKPLFEVGQPHQLRAELSVDERDIQDLKLGQKGYVATTSLPTDKYPITVERIVPLGEAKEGKNLFTVYGTLDQTSQTWRPGMVGEGRVNIEKKNIAWIWTHRLIEFVRLKLWI